MKSPYRALLWEQACTSGVICLMLGALSLFLLLVAHALVSLGGMVYVRDVVTMFFCFSVIGAVLLAGRQDTHGHIVWTIDPRWFRLPLSMPVLFAIVLGARTLFLTALVGLQFLVGLALPRTDFEEILFFATFPLYFYALTQAAGWSWKRTPILWYGLFAVLMAILLLFRFWDLRPEEIFQLIRQTALAPRVLLLLPPMLLLTTVYGIYLERQDRYFGLSSLWSLTDYLSRPFSPALPKRATALEAQFWYETRRIGWILPLLTLGFTAGIVLVLVLIADRPFSTGLGQYVPLAALIVSSLFVHLPDRLSSKTFQRQRPDTDFSITAAWLLAQLRALCITMALAFILSLLLLLAGPLERSVLVQLQTQGFYPAFDVFMVLVRPLMVAGIVAWLLLTSTGVPLFPALISFLSTSWYLYSGHNKQLYDIYAANALGGIVIVVVFTLALFGYVLWRNIVTRKQVLILTTLAFVPALLLWMGSRSLEGGQGFLLAWSLGLWLILPGISMPWTTRGQCHDIGLGRLRL